MDLLCMTWTVWTYLLTFGPGPTENPIHVPNPAIHDHACGLDRESNIQVLSCSKELSFWGDFGDPSIFLFSPMHPGECSMVTDEGEVAS